MRNFAVTGAETVVLAKTDVQSDTLFEIGRRPGRPFNGCERASVTSTERTLRLALANGFVRQGARGSKTRRRRIERDRDES